MFHKHPIRKFFRHLFRTSWWQPNRQSRKMLKEEAKKLIGYDRSVNETWAKSWKYFIKRQYPWQGIIELNQYKLIEMRDYMQNHSWAEKEYLNNQIKEMTEAIDLGNKILKDDYEKAPFSWSRENSVNITYVYQKLGYQTLGAEQLSDDGPMSKIKIAKQGKLLATLYNQDLFNEIMSDVRDEELSIAKKEFLKDKETKSVEQWLKDNNLTRKDITCAYSHVWVNDKSDEENAAYLSKLLEEAKQARQADIDKYFEHIAKHADSWGD